MRSGRPTLIEPHPHSSGHVLDQERRRAKQDDLSEKSDGKAQPAEHRKAPQERSYGVVHDVERVKTRVPRNLGVAWGGMVSDRSRARMQLLVA